MPGFTLPFQRSTGSLGYFYVTRSEISMAKESLKSLMTTNWGERVMNYHFGCNYREFLMEPLAGDELKSKIADRTMAQVEQWMPYIVVTDLNVLFPSESSDVPENGIGVRVKFALISRPTEFAELTVTTV